MEAGRRNLTDEIRKTQFEGYHSTNVIGKMQFLRFMSEEKRAGENIFIE